jgi:hypothetical protein
VGRTKNVQLPLSILYLNITVEYKIVAVMIVNGIEKKMEKEKLK